MMKSTQFKNRLRASSIHLGISLLIAALAALLVFGLWYPYPYREISGGRDLFFLVVAVDVAMGPLITLAIFNRSKPRRELVMDFTLVGMLQLAALGYGLWTVFVARPVHLVFEYSRLSVVHAVDIEPELLVKAPPALQALPLTGPTLIALRPFKDTDEQFQFTMAALGGAPLAARRRPTRSGYCCASGPPGRRHDSTSSEGGMALYRAMGRMTGQTSSPREHAFTVRRRRTIVAAFPPVQGSP